MKRIGLLLLMVCSLLVLSHGQQGKVVSTASDKVTASLAVTKNNNTLEGNQVQITVTASSSLGVITNVVWNCENGADTTGHPPWYLPQTTIPWPMTMPLTGAMPASILCVYKSAGTKYPNVFVYDSLGKQTWANTTVTVKAN